MLECLILGDEFALQASKINPSCIVAYVEESNTPNFLDTFRTYPSSNKVIISLGTYDSTSSILNLEILRKKFKNVIWILPAKTHINQRKYVIDLAHKYKDPVTEKPDLKLVTEAENKIIKDSNIKFINTINMQYSHVKTYNSLYPFYNMNLSFVEGFKSEDYQIWSSELIR